MSNTVELSQKRLLEAQAALVAVRRLFEQKVSFDVVALAQAGTHFGVIERSLKVSFDLARGEAGAELSAEEQKVVAKFGKVDFGMGTTEAENRPKWLAAQAAKSDGERVEASAKPRWGKSPEVAYNGATDEATAREAWEAQKVRR